MIIMIGHSPNMFAMPTLWLLHRLNATYPIIYEISGPYFGKNVRFLVHYWPKINCKGLQLSKCFSYAMFTNYDRWARGEKRYSLRDKSQCTHPSQGRWFDKGILDRKGWRSGDPSITRISLYLPCYKWFCTFNKKSDERLHAREMFSFKNCVTIYTWTWSMACSERPITWLEHFWWCVSLNMKI